jgi:hypothetical protein
VLASIGIPDPAYIAIAIMLALLVLTPWALWEAEQLRVNVRRQLRAMVSRSQRHDV